MALRESLVTGAQLGRDRAGCDHTLRPQGNFLAILAVYLEVSVSRVSLLCPHLALWGLTAGGQRLPVLTGLKEDGVQSPAPLGRRDSHGGGILKS